MSTHAFRRAVRPLAIACLVAAIAPSLRADDDPMPPIAAATTSPTTEPAAVTERRGKFLVEQRASVVEFLKAFPAQPAKRADEVIRVELVDGNLVFTLAPGVPDEASYPTANGSGAIKLNVMGREDANGASRVSFNFESNVLREGRGEGSGEPSATYVQIGVTPPSHFNLSLTELSPATTAISQLTASLREDETGQSDPPTVRLHFDFGPAEGVDENDPGAGIRQPGKFERSAGTFAALIEAHHDDIVTATAEAFASLRAMHVLSGLTEQQLRQVLATDAPRDANVDRDVAAILDALRKDGDAATDAVRKRMTDAGVPVAIALAAADRRGWSPDLTLHVDAVLADALPLSQRQARRILTSPTRLVDALYWPDAKVRRAVKTRLATAGAFDSRSLNAIDADADPYEQAGRIEAFRSAVLRATGK